MAKVISNFPLSYDAQAVVKRTLHKRLPHVGSSHLSEAIARALGFQTNAALQARLREGPAGGTAAFDTEAFSARLVEFEYPAAPDVSVDVEVVVITNSAGPDHGLTGPLSPLDRCAAYGVQIKRTASGQVFAHHTVGGVVGPAADEHEAAQMACAAWDI